MTGNHLELTPDQIAFTDEKLSWQEAIRLVGQPLLENETIEDRYIDAVIDSALNNGPYFDMGKGVAMPHARPEQGANKVGISFLRTKTPVFLLDDTSHPIDIFIMLAATDNHSHLEVLRTLSKVLTDPVSLEGLRSAKTPQEILAIFFS